MNKPKHTIIWKEAFRRWNRVYNSGVHNIYYDENSHVFSLEFTSDSQPKWGIYNTMFYLIIYNILMVTNPISLGPLSFSSWKISNRKLHSFYSLFTKFFESFYCKGSFNETYIPVCTFLYVFNTNVFVLIRLYLRTNQSSYDSPSLFFLVDWRAPF